ncbi:peptidoglycan DD-metalloendopeptidase family protein [Bacillus sp. FJAT-27225]|uniref:peptidoglycan DD-metalloendopeptidase family protein n=1 Tax=Bacillus sp. FJAT-27225 TaxID=1743144 RepID=UPI0009818A11|nr:peptidoglycan DD-metalloendopeptidase family protein [Bacillus sp. FJAT-27225]
MKDYIVRFLIAGIMAVCVSLLIIGGSQARASEMNDNSEWVLPTDGIITDVFGTRGGTHKGIDIAGELGVPVIAVNDGTVTKSYLSVSYGNVILVKHQNGFESVYAHLDKRLVNEGAPVKKGQKIGTMGNTGYSTGVHLHFELHKNEWTFKKENAMNPESMLGKIEIGEYMAAVPITNHHKESIEAGANLNRSDQAFHVVAAGETLWKIAHMHNLSVKQLMKLNKLNETVIHPGDELVIKNDIEQAAKELAISAASK